MPKTIVFHSAKGGVGKSTLSILAAEYFAHKGKSVRLADASGNPTAAKWIDKCRDLGRETNLSPDDPEFLIIDTQGIPDSARPFYSDLDLFVIPFQPFSEDVEESEDVFYELPEEIQDKVVFVSNRLRALGMTIEQRVAVNEVKSFIEDEQAGVFIPGLIERVAIYPLLLNGLTKNFFEMEIEKESFQKAQKEAAELFAEMEGLLP